jgi:hypothetical protein
MLEQAGENAARTERIRLEGDEDQDGGRKRVSRVLEVEVEF